MLFTFPSRYWFTIGLYGVFSLTGWSRLIHTEFLVFRNTQDTTKNYKSYLKGTVTHYGSTFQMITVQFITLYRSPTTPILPKQYWFGLIRVRSPLLTESLLFSLPPGTGMFRFPGFASYNRIIYLQYIGFPHSEICA